jgi:glycosyltransferase involved in cell wall biosynthesis
VVLVGDGPAARELQARSPSSIFAGAQSGEALSAHYASADYFIFPSLTETYGNVVPEAMASGLTVLAYDCAAAGQLIRHRENGLLAPVGRADRFVEMAAHLASDPQAAASMATRARASAESMSWERIVSQVEDTYLASIESFPADLAGSRSRSGYTGSRPSANGIRP